MLAKSLHYLQNEMSFCIIHQVSSSCVCLDSSENVHEISNDGLTVSGSYRYIDPLGSLIMVTYSDGPDGYKETRMISKNFGAEFVQVCEAWIDLW